MNKIEIPRSSTFIAALTADYVDWSLFDNPSNERKRDEEGPKFFAKDFKILADYAVTREFGRQHPKGITSVDLSEELIDFLNQNRPQTLFFEPEDISNLLTPESNIVVQHNKNRSLEKWQFRLRPPKEGGNLYRNQAITLSRRGVNPNENSRKIFINPYLIVKFPAAYYDNNVVFYPDIQMTYGDWMPRDHIQEEMVNLLGLKEHTVKQELSFYSEVKYPVKVSLK